MTIRNLARETKFSQYTEPCLRGLLQGRACGRRTAQKTITLATVPPPADTAHNIATCAVQYATTSSIHVTMLYNR